MATKLYELSQFEVHVVNPFPTDCDFTVSVLHAPPEGDPLPAQPPPKGRARSSSSQPPAPQQQQKQRQDAAATAAAGNDSSKKPVFADPFGVDRPRLRLRAGAGEKIKAFFLPFSPGTSQSESGSSHRSTLVLKDSECGEFCYELVGVVAPPAPCLEHKAVVSQENGSQVGLGWWWAE